MSPCPIECVLTTRGVVMGSGLLFFMIYNIGGPQASLHLFGNGMCREFSGKKFKTIPSAMETLRCSPSDPTSLLSARSSLESGPFSLRRTQSGPGRSTLPDRRSIITVLIQIHTSHALSA